jgi:hypothetical protein
MNEFRAFFYIRGNKGQPLLQLRIPLSRRPDGIVKEHVRRLTPIPNKIYETKGDKRTFFDV